MFDPLRPLARIVRSISFHRKPRRERREKEQQVQSSSRDASMNEWSAAQWAQSIDFGNLIAHALLAEKRRDESEIDYLRRIDEDAVRRLICGDTRHPLHAALATRIWMELNKLRAKHSATSSEMQKFVADGASFTMEYDSLDKFFSGLEGVIGPPSPNVSRAIEDEHTARADSHIPFTTKNYGITTTSATEWRFVAAPDTLPAVTDPDPRGLRALTPLVDAWVRGPLADAIAQALPAAGILEATLQLDVVACDGAAEQDAPLALKPSCLRRA